MEDQADRGAKQPVEGQKQFALLVDGYVKDLFITGMMLQRMDHDVYIVNSGEDAVRIIEVAKPFLVITELTLPQMSGLELLIRLRHDQKTREIPVIIQTAEDDDKKKELCRISGSAAFLKKPVDPALLYSTIQAATETIPREFIRLRTLLPVMVGGLAAKGRSSTTEYITELSEAGIFVRTLYPRPVGNVLPVTIIIRSIPVKVQAVVVRSVTLAPGLLREPGMGMKFVEITATDREILRNIIKGQILKDIPGQ